MRSVIVLLILTLAFPLAAQQLDAVDRIVRDSIAAWHIPGAAVAVVKDDRLIHLKGYGVRELGGAPVTPDTVFQLASTSKAFASAAMAALVDDKKMKFDDPVRRHVDYFRLGDPCADSMVTMRDIVSHRTGLSRHDEMWDYAPWTREEILHRVGQVALSKPFRSAYQYQNIMFMAATEAVESASGQEFEAFMRARFFEPLGMNNTVISEGAWQHAANRAISYSYNPKTNVYKPANTSPYETLGGAGSIKSSARDMAQWVRFQLNDGTIDGRRLVSESSLRETKTPHTILPFDDSTREDSPETNINTYAMGWRVQDYRGELLVSHGGALNSFRAQVAMLPKQKVGIVVLTNFNQGYGGISIRNEILDLYLTGADRNWNAHYQGVVDRSDARAEKRKLEREAKRHRDTKPSRELAAYAGTYESPAYGPITVAVENDALTMKWYRLTLPMTHYHFDTFHAVNEDEEIDERITFALDDSGEVKSFELFGETFRKK
jgi:CubicO group peptidase (beta-lactamase class C family)